MISVAQATLFSSAAYDERRLVDDDRKIASVETALSNDGWLLFRNIAIGNSSNSGSDAVDDDATFSNRSSGMQADVWSKDDDVVISFRGTEFSRFFAGETDSRRFSDAGRDLDTVFAWIASPLALDSLVEGQLNGVRLHKGTKATTGFSYV